MKELIHFGVRTRLILFFVGRMRILWAHVHLTSIVANLARAKRCGPRGMGLNADEVTNSRRYSRILLAPPSKRFQ
jgi:hypothetical protein